MSKDRKIEKRVIYTDAKMNETYEKISYVNSMVDENGYRFWNNKLSVKIFIEQPLPSAFIWSEKGRINELRHYILEDNQLLVYRRNRKPYPITNKEISNIFKLSISQTSRIVNKMKQYNIIKTVKVNNTKYFAFNPIYGLKAKKLPLTVYLWFEKELEPYISGYAKNRIIKQIEVLKQK